MLDQAACNFAHTMYWHKNFQALARLDQLNQGEQDRIFNELIVANIVLIMLSFEAPDLGVDHDMRDYCKALRDAMPDAHVNYLKSIGIESEHLEEWRTLIGMRFDEYARDRHGVRAAAMQLESKDKDLELDDLSKIQIMVPLHSVAIGCHHHICRSKTDGRDDLFLFILNHLGRFYVEFRAMSEGVKITRFKRAIVATYRFFRRLRQRLHITRKP